MKKSLSLLLAFALVFSMFSSLAFAADELSVEQKYEALKAAGIFAGMPDGSAGLDQKMTRAQFARVAGLLAGLDVDAKPTTKTFSDVAETHWAYEEIEAAAAAGLVEGMGDGTFNPSGNVTIQQLAVVAAKILKLDPVEDAEVEGAADWAAPYIKALQNAGVPLPTNYTDDALRSDLVNVSYAVAEITGVVAPAKVSVVSAKPVGVSKVEVQLDKAVDTEKAKFELKLGAATIELEKTEWADNKKSAILVLKDTKIREGEYTVTLTGLDPDTVANASAKFNGEKETVKSIEFVTASDEIAKSRKAKIKVRPENQYGEIASFNVSAYTVSAADLTPSKKIDDEGYLIITLDTSNKTTGLDVIPVYVYFNENRVMATKTFKVGSIPFVSKMELGEVSYNNPEKALITSGNTATIPVYLYDQYGNPVTPEQADADNTNINWSSYITPFTLALDTTYDDTDDQFKVKVSVKPNQKIEKTSTFQINIFAGAATASTTLNAKSQKVARKVTIGDPDKVIAAGDKEAIIPIYVFDEEGNQLTGQEIVDNRENIKVTGASLILYGKDKGKLRVTNIPTVKNSYFSVSVLIQSNVGEAPGYDNKNFQVAEERYPTALKIETRNAPKAVLNGASSEFKVIVIDQYGSKLGDGDTNFVPGSTYTVEATVTGVTYAVAESKKNSQYDLDAEGQTITFTYKDSTDGFDAVNEGYNFVSKGVPGITTVKFALKEGNEVIDTKTVRIETIAANSKLNYALDDIGDLYAAIDKKDVFFKEQQDGSGNLDPASIKVAKKVGVKVTDASGQEVAFPNRVTEVVVSNADVAVAAVENGEGFVLGNKAGTASVTAYVLAADGTIKAMTKSVTVKNDPVVITKLEAKDAVEITSGATHIADLLETIELKATDNYGITFEKNDVYAYDDLLKVRFTISDVRADGLDNTVTINYEPNKISLAIGSDVQEFTITAVSPNGDVTVSTLIHRPNIVPTN